MRTQPQIFTGAAIGGIVSTTGFTKNTAELANGAGVILVEGARNLAKTHGLDLGDAMRVLMHQVASSNIEYAPFDGFKDSVEESFAAAAEKLSSGAAQVSSKDHSFYAVFLGMNEACQDLEAEIS